MLHLLQESLSLKSITKQDDMKSSYLWHCHLGHINERRMTKLHKDGSLGSFDYESYDTCESCLLCKMTKLPFKGKGEHAKGPLGLIHADMYVVQCPYTLEVVSSTSLTLLMTIHGMGICIL